MRSFGLQWNSKKLSQTAVFPRGVLHVHSKTLLLCLHPRRSTTVLSASLVHPQMQVSDFIRTTMPRRNDMPCRRVVRLHADILAALARCCHFTSKGSCRARLHLLNAIFRDPPQYSFALHFGKPYSSCTALHTKSRTESHSQCALAKQQKAFISNGALRLSASNSNHTTKAMWQVSVQTLPHTPPPPPPVCA